MDLAPFEDERPRLTAIATRILGSEANADADDVVQDASVPFSNAADIDDPPAWLTTVVTRLCLDTLRKRRTRDAAEARVQARGEVEPGDPEGDAVAADQVGGAVQIVLHTLAPAESAAFVLHDVFGYRFDEIGAILGRSGTAVRQLASRARRKVQGEPEPGTVHVLQRSIRPPVHQELTAVDVRRGIGRKEHTGADHVVGIADPFHRVRRRCAVAHRRGPGGGDVGVEGTRQDDVGTDLRCEGPGQAQGEGVQPGFGHRIGEVERHGAQ